MKKIISMILLTLIISVFGAMAVSADCSNMVMCMNQDESPFCGPEDTSCDYVTYVSEEDSCVESDAEKVDTDADGWADGCDAFPEDDSEVTDIDGDGVGYNTDCDDFNSANTDVCGDETDEEGSEEEGSDEEGSDEEGSDDKGDSEEGASATGTDGSGRSAKSICIPVYECSDYSKCQVDGYKYRTCEKINICDSDFDKPKEKMYCPTSVTFSSSPVITFTEKSVEEDLNLVVVEEEDEEEELKEEGESNIITGNVVSMVGNKGNVFLLLFTLTSIIIYFLIAKRKQDKDYPTTI